MAPLAKSIKIVKTIRTAIGILLNIENIFKSKFLSMNDSGKKTENILIASSKTTNARCI